MVVVLQQQPSEISLYRDSNQFILQERTNTHWLFGILGIWAIPGSSIALVSFLQGMPIWITTIALTVTLAGLGMTLFSWIVTQTLALDADTNTITVAQKRLFGQTNCDRHELDEILTVQLMPKTRTSAWSFYIAVRLESGKNLELDLTSGEAVDRKVVRSMREFLSSHAESAAFEECVSA